ncbi:MAG: AMP-dependent synthetase/ligase [Cyclobacteriaceae bacterium]|nr:AMP-dependent synthetase/ligase [Cyclobacteriaceae bacterium]
MNSAASLDFSRVFDVLDYQLLKHPQQRAFNIRRSGKWHNLSAEEAERQSDRLACWFISQGLAAGTCVALIPRGGSPEWLLVDFAVQKAGLIVVPLHATASAEETRFILNETEAPLCISADTGLYYKVLSLAPQTRLTGIYHWQPDAAGYFPAFQYKPSSDELTRLTLRKNQISEEQVSAILYTSGTGGNQKGVMLTHKNIVSSIKSVLPLMPVKPGDRVLSFLPVSHVFERTTCYAYVALGLEIYFSQARETLATDFLQARPHLFTSVPKTLERMYAILQEKALHKNPIIRWVMRKALRLGESYNPYGKWSVLHRLQLLLARLLVYDRWKRALGGKVRYIIVGAAALRPAIARLFSASGILTLSGYGMTETSPYITVNRVEPGMNKFGTVGIAVPGVQIRIHEPDENGEGEICVHGPNVMAGYFKRDDLTKEVLVNGWLHTGDVGKLEDGRFLTITGRKKEIFKTTTGLYVSPVQLENHFTASPFINQCMIIGFNRPYVTALVVPHFGLLKAWCLENKIHWTAPAYMVHNIKVIQKMQEEINRLNEPLESYKRIRKFILTDSEWTAESGELTVSFKLIREKLVQRYAKEIEKMYA